MNHMLLISAFIVFLCLIFSIGYYYYYYHHQQPETKVIYKLVSNYDDGTSSDNIQRTSVKNSSKNSSKNVSKNSFKNSSKNVSSSVLNPTAIDQLNTLAYIYAPPPPPVPYPGYVYPPNGYPYPYSNGFRQLGGGYYYEGRT